MIAEKRKLFFSFLFFHHDLIKTRECTAHVSPWL